MEDLIFFIHVYLGIGFVVSYLALIALTQLFSEGGLSIKNRPLIATALAFIFWWPMFVYYALKEYPKDKS